MDLTAFQYVYGTGAGFPISGFAAIGAALLSGGPFIGVAAMLNLNTLRTAVLAR